MKRLIAKPGLWLNGLAILALLALLALPFTLPPARAQAAAPTPPACSGETYTVGQGDTWYSVSRSTGVSVAVLKQLNPAAVRPNGWLWIGDRLCLAFPRDAASGSWYEVKPGDTWNTVSRATGVSVQELWAVNPALANRLYWLYIGQRVWVPRAATTAAETQAAAETPAAAATPAAAGVVETAPVAEATPAAEATAAAAPTSATAATAVPAPAIKAGCAADLDGYPDLILAYLNKAGNKPNGLKDWLAGCDAVTADLDAVATAALQTATSTDVIVALHEPAQPPPAGSGMFLVYHQSPAGYTLAHKVASAGSASLLTVADLNVDKRPDLAWVDTTCDADTCISELHVDSWDGSAYQDWIEGAPAMASAEFKFTDVLPAGGGQEIVLFGGLSAAADAGPQRARTETYAAIDGAAYALHSVVFEPSTCLYHKILDANAAFDLWAQDGFDAAITAYQAAIEDQKATACGTITAELATLRDFARFRLAIAQYGAGSRAQAQVTLAQITTPNLRGAAQAFSNAYKSSGSIIQACREVGVYARAHPASYEFLADWGSANPTFTAEELCPLK